MNRPLFSILLLAWNELENEESPDHWKTLPDFQPSDPGYESAPTSPYSIDDSNPGNWPRYIGLTADTENA